MARSFSTGLITYDRRFVPIDDIDVFTLIDLDGKDLTGMTVRKCDKIPISDIVEKLR